MREDYLLVSLIEVAAPPGNPVGTGAPELWSKLETSYALTFPDDYKAFIDTYGNGRFADFFGLPSPFQTPTGVEISFEEFVSLRLKGMLFAQKTLPDDSIAYPIYPAPGGLFPFGYTDNGGTICWLTVGSSRDWLIVCLDRGYQRSCDVFKLGTVVFIEKWLRNIIPVPSLRDASFRGGV